MAGNKKITFFSYRVIAEDLVRKRMYNKLEELVKEGAKEFIFINNDTLTKMGIVNCLKLKEQYNIKLLSNLANILTIREFKDRFTWEHKFLVNWQDTVTTTINIKNVINESDILITYSGCKNIAEIETEIINYAKSVNKKVINLFEEDDITYENEVVGFGNDLKRENGEESFM